MRNGNGWGSRIEECLATPACWSHWAFPLTVIGMNSIAMYLMSQLLKPWTRETLQTHLGSSVDGSGGALLAQTT